LLSSEGGATQTSQQASAQKVAPGAQGRKEACPST
jgi:hypothetical protein